MANYNYENYYKKQIPLTGITATKGVPKLKNYIVGFS
ncbi:hypothetical protein KCTC52924_00837 [Arenibacter antarcticus]